MAKPNYSFEKRQRDLAKKKKKEEKRLKKAEAKAGVKSEEGEESGEVMNDQLQEVQPLPGGDTTDT
ncbi:MAG TPA: hypothetical protein ENI05_07100 [Porticoccus sp.]|nr:hypothetical protein [Porticoccus sp.]